ncbi:MAG TPA: biopolymer transporter ExbD [Candidatus Angelobacter sp.]|jgi:biopolymer transport protein ExbD|nr:biopolymer transporter ExbD [Bryobacteraceae bacterium]HWY26557.1 biopolymer transporter ExbD [Candidatus Angelobacter sp.]
MGMAVGGNKGAMSEPNIVPLIDVLLVLIIIFMVITPTTPKGMDALVPQPTPPNQKQDEALLAKTIVVQVTASGKVMINQDQTTWDDLGPRLDDIFKTRAEKVAFVKGDDAVEFAQVARAIDIMRGSGIDKVGLITAKVEAGQ